MKSIYLFVLNFVIQQYCFSQSEISSYVIVGMHSSNLIQRTIDDRRSSRIYDPLMKPIIGIGYRNLLSKSIFYLNIELCYGKRGAKNFPDSKAILGIDKRDYEVEFIRLPVLVGAKFKKIELDLGVNFQYAMTSNGSIIFIQKSNLINLGATVRISYFIENMSLSMEYDHDILPFKRYFKIDIDKYGHDRMWFLFGYSLKASYYFSDTSDSRLTKID